MACDAISAPSNYLSRCWHIITCQTPGTNLREIWIKIHIFLSRKCTWKNMICKVASILQTSIYLIRYGTRRAQNSSNEISFKGRVHSIIIVRRAGLLLSQQDFEWRWSVPLFQCLTVLEFYFILFDLCLLITFFNFIMNYVPIVTFWIFTYHKIWILSIMFCFIWSHWIIYFLACL